jgi:hypothetical protein
LIGLEGPKSRCLLRVKERVKHLLAFNVGLSSLSTALLNDLFNGKLDVLLNHIEEISVRDLPCLLEVNELKNF